MDQRESRGYGKFAAFYYDTGAVNRHPLTGVTLSRRRNKKPWLGGLLGAAGALAVTYLTFYARRQLMKKTGLPDPLAGLVEDVLMIAAGKKLLSK